MGQVIIDTLERGDANIIAQARSRVSAGLSMQIRGIHLDASLLREALCCFESAHRPPVGEALDSCSLGLRRPAVAMTEKEVLEYLSHGKDIYAVKAIQMLCVQSERVASKVLTEKLKSTLLRGCTSSVASDGKSIVISKSVAARLILKLPDGTKGGKMMSPAGSIQLECAKILESVFGGTTPSAKMALTRLERQRACVCEAEPSGAQMIWNLILWSKSSVFLPQAVGRRSSACAGVVRYTLAMMAELVVALGGELLLRLGKRRESGRGREELTDAFEKIDTHKFSGVTWEVGRMSLLCRRSLAQIGRDAEPGIKLYKPW